MKKSIDIAFTGGGTGGHIYPGLAVIEALKDKKILTDHSCVWIGSGNPLEKDILRRFNIPFRAIPSGKLRRYFSFLNFIDLFKIAAGFVCAFFILLRLRPKVLFSKGGFVSVPPVIAARLLRIPVITHESDRDPGLATKINSRFADQILVAYKETVGLFSKDKQARICVTGNPVRKEVLNGQAEKAYSRFSISKDKPLILVLGGSQGAEQINQMILEVLDPLLENAQVVHQMGAKGFKESTSDGYIAAPFFQEEYSDLLAAADLVISRGGAGSLWEIAAAGKPSILIPLSTGASRGDQVRNSRAFEQAGASIVLEGETATGQILLEKTRSILLSPDTRDAMVQAVLSMGAGDGAVKAADAISELIKLKEQKEGK